MPREIQYNKPTTMSVTDAEFTLIQSMINDRVKAIKFLREQYNLGLYEAKVICEVIWGFRVDGKVLS